LEDGGRKEAGIGLEVVHKMKPYGHDSRAKTQWSVEKHRHRHDECDHLSPVIVTLVTSSANAAMFSFIHRRESL
jgi:hypothetical protein